MGTFEDHEEEYRGPVTVILSIDAQTGPQVMAHLSGHFSPLTGDYRWVGRLSADPSITEAYQAGMRTVTVRNPSGPEGIATLDAPNPWGGHSIKGVGAPPFPLPRITFERD